MDRRVTITLATWKKPPTTARTFFFLHHVRRSHLQQKESHRQEALELEKEHSDGSRDEQLVQNPLHDLRRDEAVAKVRRQAQHRSAEVGRGRDVRDDFLALGFA